MNKEELLNFISKLPVFIFDDKEDLLDYHTRGYSDDEKYINLQDLYTYIDLEFDNK